ncbi:MAG: CPBP family intramembrane glutamic endopeptidase, partial [Pseudomonadota bacterium]|nr:CPBP family intramembrane glutamic endopeptidase [Pseudomonadota bacterium]
FGFALGPAFVIEYVLVAVIAAFSEKVDKILAGECLEILNGVRYDMITMVFLAYTAASLIRVTKYMAELPQKALEGAKGIKESVVLKVNKIKEALSPTELDYSKLFRNIVSCLVFMTLLSVPEMLLLGVPVINWTAWSIIACHQVASVLVQTVTEEIISRRGLVEQEKTTVDKLIILVSSTDAFALAHLGNPEFAIIRSNPYAVFAMLGGSLAGGLVYGLVCIMSGGIELAWALHFANNFFIATIMGYTPSPLSHYPLYLTVHDESYGPTKYLLGLSSYGQALSYWGAVFYGELLMLVPVFVCESFARPRYDVESVCGYVSYGDMANEENSQKEAKGKSETIEKVTSKPGMFESMWGRGMSRIFAF